MRPEVKEYLSEVQLMATIEQSPCVIFIHHRFQGRQGKEDLRRLAGERKDDPNLRVLFVIVDKDDQKIYPLGMIKNEFPEWCGEPNHNRKDLVCKRRRI